LGFLESGNKYTEKVNKLFKQRVIKEEFEIQSAVKWAQHRFLHYYQLQ